MKNRLAHLFLIVIVLCVSIFYIVNESLPFVMDDALYAHIYPESPIDNESPHSLNVENEIQTFRDVLKSQYHHYFTKNGRAGVHLIVQCFCGLWGKNSYNICSTIVFLLFVFLLGRLTIPENGRINYMGYCCLGIFLFLFLIPEPTCLYNGIAYGVNYLWSSVFCLVFLYALKRENLSSRIYGKVLLCLIAFLAGWSHEGLVIAICCSVLVWGVSQKFRLSHFQWGMIVCFGVGAALLVLAPSNFSRAMNMNGENADWAGGVIALHFRVFRFLRASYVWMIVFLLLYFLHPNRAKSFVSNNCIYVTAWLAALAFVWGVGALNVRAAYGVDFFAIILLLRVLPEYSVFRNNLQRVCIFSALLLLIGGGGALYYQLPASRQYHEIDRILEQSSDPDCLVLLEDVNSSWWIKRYVCQYKFDEPWENWEERVLCWRNKKHKILIAEVSAENKEEFLLQCMNPQYKMPGENPFYRIGNYLYCLGPFPSNIEMQWILGDFQAYDISSAVKKWASCVFPPQHSEMNVVMPIEKYHFQYRTFGRIALSPHSSRIIERMDVIGTDEQDIVANPKESKSVYSPTLYSISYSIHK